VLFLRPRRGQKLRGLGPPLELLEHQRAGGPPRKAGARWDKPLRGRPFVPASIWHTFSCPNPFGVGEHRSGCGGPSGVISPFGVGAGAQACAKAPQSMLSMQACFILMR
jgi:hypothetical protein